MTELETEKLVPCPPRPFVREDLDELARVSADPGTRGFDWQESVDHEAMARHLRGWMEACRQGLEHLAMIHKPDGAIVGNCGLGWVWKRSASGSR